MRKIALFCLCGLTAASILTGCSGSADGNVNLGTVTLSEYKGVTVNIEAPEVTDEEVDTKVETILAQNPNEVEVDRAAKEGDIVNIDFKGTKDGEAFEGGSAEDQDLELGSGKMIEGFESGLIGAKKGETKTLNLTFPEDYQAEDLAGQDVVFEVKIHEVAEKHVPELTDEFVAENFPELGTVDAYKADLKQQMLDAKTMQSEQQRDAELLAAVVENSGIACATDEVNEVYDQQIQYYTSMAGMYGMGLADYAAMMGMDEDGFRTEVRKMSEQTVKQQMALMEIAKKEKLTVEDADREALAEEYKDAYESVDDMIEKAGAENVDNAILYDKAIQVVVDNADVTNVDGLAVAE